MTPMDGSTGSAVGIVLAGGQSRRMGCDKAMLLLQGETLVARAARTLRTVVLEVAVADAGRGYLPDLPSVLDGPGAGPAAGILGAAQAYPERPLLVLGCDLPRVTAQLLALLLSERSADLVLPESGSGAEPLCALYGPRALAELRRRVDRGHYALHALAECSDLNIRWLGFEAWRHCGDPASLFTNWNRPLDLA